MRIYKDRKQINANIDEYKAKKSKGKEEENGKTGSWIV